MRDCQARGVGLPSMLYARQHRWSGQAKCEPHTLAQEVQVPAVIKCGIGQDAVRADHLERRQLRARLS